MITNVVNMSMNNMTIIQFNHECYGILSEYQVARIYLRENHKHTQYLQR